MRRVFLCTEIQEVKRLLEAGEEAHPMHAAENIDLSSGEVVIVGEGDEAKSQAAGLVARGLPASRVSYIDFQKGDNPEERWANPKHFFWDDVVPLAEISDEAKSEYYKTGLDFLDMNLAWRWRLPELVVMAGAYGSGKSTVAQNLAAAFANGPGRNLGSGAMLCSWEDSASEVRDNFAAFGEGEGVDDMLRRVHFVRRHPDEERLVAWYMELVEYHKERYGTRFFVLDPWNEMDHQKDMRQSETDYVRDMMKAFRRMVDKLQIILIVATHVPAKVIKGDGAIEPFKIGHAFGSVQFANKADRGICVVRTKKFEKTKGHTILRLDKSKIERRMGRKGTIALRLEDRYFRFEYDAYVTGEVKDVWKD